MGPDAGRLAQVVADAPEDRRKRIVLPRDADRLREIAAPDGVHVERHGLVHRAGIDAGRLDAVEGAQRACGLAAVHPERRLAVAPVVAHRVRVRVQVEPGGRGDRRRVAAGRTGEAAGRRRIAAGRGGAHDEVGRVRRADRVERLVGLLHVLQHPEVAAALEQVGCDGDRAHPGGQEGRDVEAVGPAGERERKPALELVGQPGGQVGRHRVERPAGQVHRGVPPEDRPPVLNLERVRELEAERETLVGGHPAQAVEHRDGVRILEVVPERRIGNRHVRVAEVVVDDLPDVDGAEQRRVALDRRVKTLLDEEVLGDPLDLVGRAPVHRGQRDRVRQASRNLDLTDRGLVLLHDVDVGRQVGRGIRHRVEVPLDVGLQHPLEVVADAHVEDHPGRVPRPAEAPMEGMDQDPGPQVLVERLVDLELLRPLDVVALVGHVDAGLVHIELVERLDRLELEHPGADDPRRDQVLGHLGVRPGRHAERGFQLDAVLAQAEAVARTGHEERRARDVEETVLLLELGEHPVSELLHRDGMETVGHRCSLVSVRGRVGARRVGDLSDQMLPWGTVSREQGPGPAVSRPPTTDPEHERPACGCPRAARRVARAGGSPIRFAWRASDRKPGGERVPASPSRGNGEAFRGGRAGARPARGPSRGSRRRRRGSDCRR